MVLLMLRKICNHDVFENSVSRDFIFWSKCPNPSATPVLGTKQMLNNVCYTEDLRDERWGLQALVGFRQG